MDRIPGVVLDDVWRDMSLDDKIAIAAQLKDYFDQLRAIPPPKSPSICSVTGGPIIYSRLHAHMEWCGPYRDEEHLNTQLRRRHPVEDFDPVVQASQKLAHPLVFTHNDFSPRNVMVMETPAGWKVTGIIDWECAGWLPSYWDYCKAVNWNALNASCGLWNWEGWIPKIIEPFEQPKRISSWYRFHGPMSLRLVPDLSIYLVVLIIRTLLKPIHTSFPRYHSTVT